MWQVMPMRVIIMIMIKIPVKAQPACIMLWFRSQLVRLVPNPALTT